MTVDGPSQVFTKRGAKVQLMCHVQNRKHEAKLSWSVLSADFKKVIGSNTTPIGFFIKGTTS